MPHERDLGSLAYLLGCSVDDPQLEAFVEDIEKKHPRLVVHADYVGYMEFKKKGISIVFKKAEWLMDWLTAKGKLTEKESFVVEAIHVYAMGADGYQEYGWPLVGNIRFGDSRETIHMKLGPPDRHGGGTPLSYDKTRVWPHWDAYDFSEYSVICEYSDENMRLAVVSLMVRPL